MNNTLLISEKILKQYSLINDNTDAMYILPAIRSAQDIGLQPIIGTSLYDKLKNLVADSTIKDEENTKYKELLDNYVVPYLCWKTMSEIQMMIQYKMRNAGLVQNSDVEHYQTTYMNQTQYVKEWYDDKAVFYVNRLSDYLMANEADYPEYCEWRNCSDMKANRNAYNCGIYLGHTHCCGEHPDVIIINNKTNH